MSKQFTVSSAVKHLLQIINNAIDFTLWNNSHFHHLLVRTLGSGVVRHFVISSAASGTKLPTFVPPTWRLPGGGYLAPWLLKEACRFLNAGPASSSSDSHPVFVLGQPAHRSADPLHQILKAQGSCGGMWLKDVPQLCPRDRSLWKKRSIALSTRRGSDGWIATAMLLFLPARSSHPCFRSQKKKQPTEVRC